MPPTETPDVLVMILGGTLAAIVLWAALVALNNWAGRQVMARRAKQEEAAR